MEDRMTDLLIRMGQGRQIASFNVGDSRCVLRNDQIRCAPAKIK